MESVHIDLPLIGERDIPTYEAPEPAAPTPCQLSIVARPIRAKKKSKPKKKKSAPKRKRKKSAKRSSTKK